MKKLRYCNEYYRTMPDEKIKNICQGLWRKDLIQKYTLSREEHYKWFFFEL